jgi:drug/metabolite transporter (DMT)-like permease
MQEENKDSARDRAWSSYPRNPLARPRALVTARWGAMSPVTRGISLFSVGSLTLVVMATLVKALGTRLPAMEILFFRSFIGLLFVLPLFARDPLEPFRTKRLGMHFLRGATGAVGNACFFWTLTHMLLADAMALQFSRPLFMIPLALMFLGEIAGWRRTGVSIIGFIGILFYARPFTSGFDPSALIGALGAFAGGLVLIWIKRLARSEPTRIIMFYYAFWNAAFAFVPAALFWVTPSLPELAVLVLIGFLGISGQTMMTQGITQADATVLVPLDYSRIVYSAVLGYLLFGELPGVWSFVGMALIVTSSLYLVLTEKRSGATVRGT